MSYMDYCSDNQEAQFISTNCKPTIRENPNSVFINEKKNKENKDRYQPIKSNINRNNPNIYARGKNNGNYMNNFGETYQYNSISPGNKNHTPNTINKPVSSILNENQDVVLSNIKENLDNTNTIRNLNNSKGRHINFNNEGRNDIFLKQRIGNISIDKYPITNNLISNKIKPKNNNLSLNLINSNNFFKRLNNNLSQNNILIKTAVNKNSLIKSQFITKQSNPTILKSSFIMTGIQKKNNNESNNKDVELQSILIPNDKRKINKQKFHFNTIILKSKNDSFGISKDKLAKNSICKYDNVKTQKINSPSKSKNKSIYYLTNSQNENLNKIENTNQDRSISFNNLKSKSFANTKYVKSLNQNNSQNYTGFITQKAAPIANSDIHSLEKKKTLDLINSNYQKLLCESKSQSIIKINKKYNEVYRHKKLATSLTAKTLKISTDKGPVNVNLNQNQVKQNLEENLIKTIENNHQIIKPMKKNNSFISKELINLSNLKEINISDLHNPNENEIHDLKRKLESHSSNNGNINDGLKTNLNKNSKNKNGSKIDNESLRNSNLADPFKSKSKNKNMRNSISKESRISKDFSSYNGLLKLQNDIKRPLNNYEAKSKFRNRIVNEEKFKELYNPKQKNKVKINSSTNNIQCGEAKADSENKLKLRDNLNNLAKLEDQLNKKLKTKNQTFSSNNSNWNNLFLNAKSNSNLLAKNNKIQRNKSDNNSQIASNDDLIKKKKNDFTAKQIDFSSINIKKDDLNSMKKLTLDSHVNKSANVCLFKTCANDQIAISKDNVGPNKNNKSLFNKENVNLAINSARIRDDNIIFDLKNEEVKRATNPITDIKLSEEMHFKNLEKQTVEDKSMTNSLIIKTANERIISKINNDIKGLFETNNNNLNNAYNDIKIFEKDSDIKLMDLSIHNKLDPEKELIFNNINATASDVNCEEIEFESESSKNGKDKIANQEDSNKFKYSFSNLIKNLENDESQEKIDSENLKSNLILQSKESTNNDLQKNTEESDCPSKYADDIEDMNTLMKRLDFTDVCKKVESVFKITSKVYHEFNFNFKTEIEAHLFPQKNQINSVRKRNDSNSKSVSTQDTSSKKTISPHNYKSLKGIKIESGREKINLYNVHLSKI